MNHIDQCLMGQHPSPPTWRFPQAEKSIRRALICSLLAYSAAVHCAPKLSPDSERRSECSRALDYANAQYESSAPRLYESLEADKGYGYVPIYGTVKRTEEKIVPIDTKQFFDSTDVDGRDTIYWESKKSSGSRIVVREFPEHNAFGDYVIYQVYKVDDSKDREKFVSEMSKETKGGSADTRDIFSSELQPAIFRNTEAGTSWAIDFGERRHDRLAPWKIYDLNTREKICEISFAPQGADFGKLLPDEVKRFMGLLDRAVGKDDKSGGRYIAHLRRDLQHVLANAVYRPWALADSEAYNLRTEVDAGLIEWAEQNEAQKRQYAEILKQYPRASRALTTYYEKQFKLSSQGSMRFGTWALDLIFRAHFTFPGDFLVHVKFEKINSNPWSSILN